MGAYENLIQLPISGQPISVSQYGIPVRNAIMDLDRRISAYDASTGVGKAYSTSILALTNTNETAALTITGQVFRAGYAYKATMRMGVRATPANGWLQCRVRKYNAVVASGADWGEYYRFTGYATASSGLVMSAIGTIYLLNTTALDVTSDVSLVVQASASGVDSFATVNSPRYFTIEPAGFASDYVGMGVVVS